MANGSSACCRGVLLVLVLAVAHAAGAATAGAPAEAPAHARQLLPREESLPPPSAEGEGEGAVVPRDDAAACVRSILEASRPCARDVLETLVLKVVHLSPDCCRVLAAVGDKCVVAVFSGGAVGPALRPIVNRVCGLIGTIG